MSLSPSRAESLISPPRTERAYSTLALSPPLHPFYLAADTSGPRARSSCLLFSLSSPCERRKIGAAGTDRRGRDARARRRPFETFSISLASFTLIFRFPLFSPWLLVRFLPLSLSRFSFFLYLLPSSLRLPS